MTISSQQADWTFNDAPPALVLSHLSHLGLIDVSGEQARSFIHGQVTTDITSLDANQWKWGAHCDPKGKMLASFRTFAIADKLMMLMPTDTIDVDLPQLQKYAVFSKAELVNVTHELALIGISGAQAQAFVRNHIGDVSAAVNQHADITVLVDDDRFIIILPVAQVDELVAKANVALTDKTHWQALEIKAGYPNIHAQHANQYVPQMCNLQAIDGISFNKGCYMGQETIARMKYRGGNKRALYIVTGTCTTEINADTQLEIADEDGFRRGGNIIEFVQQGEQVLLTAVLANDTLENAKLRVKDDEASTLTLTPLPYSLLEQEQE
ncbi:tRNA-modifying protein YgfZ [Shewanella intestini]|uniref:tRNA-modifying protein YgfZ n=1 Tax=Shewanella intestini TaxID=2017544 RepID=A0ABS5I5A5_9GAMM|nr:MULTISPECIES: tRNA-modifying protein YgfZ [Shewanella]MBR9729203.1 tRNA-modifying protein YgfZ [Shewanella intestini]MRG37226.1 tRNA-modifying protein YgfZ [Shewanella sp. XMDDZSB0408]